MKSTLAIAFLLLVSFSAFSENKSDLKNTSNKSSENINIENAYIRLMPPGSANTAAFMKIKNTSDFEVSLVKAEADISATVELHGHKQVDGVFKMFEVDKFTIPAKSESILKPGDNHIMFMKLKRDLKIDEVIKLNLIFSDKTSKEIEIPVKMNLKTGSN